MALKGNDSKTFSVIEFKLVHLSTMENLCIVNAHHRIKIAF